MTMTVLLAVVFGSLIGLLLGLVGGGGSILTVPILVYVLDQGVHEATATSLVIVGATALIGAVPHARAGRVAIRTALLFGGSGIAGAFAGTALNARVSGPVILLLFGLLMLAVAARMAVGSRPVPGEVDDAPLIGFRWEVVASGLVVGVLTGFFGVGGGFLIVPALVLVLGLPMRLAVGTSLVVIAINAAAGIVAHLGSGGSTSRWRCCSLSAVLWAPSSAVGWPERSRRRNSREASRFWWPPSASTSSRGMGRL